MPYYFVESNHIRHYLLVAENDQIVHLSNAVDFDHVLNKHGNHSQLITIPRTGHVSIMGSVSSLFSRYFKTKHTIMQALEETLNS